MLKSFKSSFFVFAFFSLIFSGCASWKNSPQQVAKDLNSDAAITVERFRKHEKLKEFEKFLDQAYAVIIFPNVVKAGLFYGGEAGNGVLLMRDPKGGWSDPTYVSIGAASFGLQVGIQETAIVLILRNEGALRSVLNHQGKLGADTGATIGLWGLGMEASVTSNLDVDILAFANANVGAYIGISLEGAVIAKRSDLNEAIYGKGATPEKILSGNYKNNQIDRLRKILGEY